MTALPLQASVKRADWVYVSGQIGIHEGKIPEDVEAQTQIALRNLQKVLEKEKKQLSDVVKTTVFMTSMDHYKDMNTIYAQFFPVDPPARSAIAVRELPLGALVEIEAVAYSDVA